MNGKETQKLREFYQIHVSRGDLIMQTLNLAGFDDRVIDFISDGLWSKRQAIIGLKFDYQNLPTLYLEPVDTEESGRKNP